MMEMDCKPHMKNFAENMLNHKRALFETQAQKYGIDSAEA